MRPFFPPSTSLQSVNLRAALLRQLTELKKDGVLGPTVILRKTMVDECKGDKFEELLATFSTIVLKKRLPPTSQKLGAGPIKTSNVVPLILSYRKGIQRDLQTRKELGLRAKQQERSIDASIEALSAEATELKRRKAPEIPEHAESLARIVRENWIGDHAWVETILYGVPPSEGADPGLSQSDIDPESPSRLLGDLEAKVEAQTGRLQHWQSYLKTLQERRRKQPPQQPTTQQPQPKPTRFGRHQSLVAGAHNSEDRTAPNSAEYDLNQQLEPQHATLLQSLDRELTLGHRKRVPGSRDLSTDSFEAHRADSVVDARNARPLLARASSSRSSDVSSQRTVVDEGFARPNADSRSSSSSGASRTPVRSSTANVGLLGRSTNVDKSTGPGALAGQQSLLDRTRASLAQFGTPSARPQKTLHVVGQAKDVSRPVVNAQSAKQQSERASLLERTRESMSLLTNVLDENYLPISNNRSKKPAHVRSKTAIHVPQRPRLERAWSEESLASTATKEDNLDFEADYESVFKSRPRLAMSPNLSPQHTGGDLWLESQLEEGMNKLTIDSSPDI